MLQSWFIPGAGWRLQAAAGGVLLLVLFVALARVVGAKAAARIVAAAGGACAAWVYGRRERQAGWTDAHAKGERDAQAAIDLAGSARADALRAADAGRLRDDDGYRRD